jgi:DNA-binding response OmpR family regulator
MKKILLVEDDQFLGSLMKNRFVKEGFDIDWVMNGDDAIAKLKEAPHDLILMDIILPGASGFEVMEKITAEPQVGTTPIIIISNLGQESDIARGRELGAAAYLVKADTPIDLLVQKVREFLKV